MKKYKLSIYVFAVIIALVIVNCLAWLIGGGIHTRTMEIFSVGFLLGILAMYIATYFYKSNIN